jgi:hypothetical protein
VGSEVQILPGPCPKANAGRQRRPQWFSVLCTGGVAQRESTCFARRGSSVQIRSPPPITSSIGAGLSRIGPDRTGNVAKEKRGNRHRSDRPGRMAGDVVRGPPLGERAFDLCQGESGSGASLGVPRSHSLTGREVAQAARSFCPATGQCVQRRCDVLRSCASDAISVDGSCAWRAGPRLGAARRSRAREGHSVDALAPGGDEGRGTLR